MIWILILDDDNEFQPPKSISLVVMGWEHVFTACVFAMWLNLLGFMVCRNPSTIDCAENVLNPTPYLHTLQVLSISVLSYL